MTREEARKAAEVIKAYAEGKVIEFRKYGDTIWEVVGPYDANNLGFNFEEYEYRIKKEPSYRPFKNREECWNEMLKHQPFGWLKAIESGNYYEINGVLEPTDFEHYARRYKFADGTPFGIKED